MAKRKKLRRRSRRIGNDALLSLIRSGVPWEGDARTGLLPVSDRASFLLVARLFHLVYGHDHFGLSFDDETEMVKCWNAIGEELTAQHASRFPGTRPWGWWRFEALSSRRILSGTVDVCPTSVDWFGIPSAWGGDGIHESQGSYLARHDLLLDGEVAAVGTPDPDPPAIAWAKAVCDGSIDVCKTVRWSCQRFLDDLASAHARGYWLDRRLADRRIKFCRWVAHYQGDEELKGTVFRPEPWQQFCYANIYGYVRANGKRRFKTAFRMLPRKHGKTIEASIDAIYCTVADGEAGAENFSVGTQKVQSEKTFRDAVALIEASPILSSLIEIRHNRFVYGKCVFRPLAYNPKGNDSHNVYLAVIDELHAHPDGKMVNLMESGTLSRSQALINIITTAGYNLDAFGGQRYLLYRSIVDPDNPNTNDSVFAFIATLDAETYEDAIKEAMDPANRRRVLLNLGVSVFEDAVQAEVDKAQMAPAEWPDVLCKVFNFYLTTKDGWLNLDQWIQCGHALAKLDPLEYREQMLVILRAIKAPCVAGLDLSRRVDLTALVLWFKVEDLQGRILEHVLKAAKDMEKNKEFFYALSAVGGSISKDIVIPYFWLPSARVEEASKRDNVTYGIWADQGFLTLSPGKEISQMALEFFIVDLKGSFDLRLLGYDPSNASLLAERLDKKHDVSIVPFRQSYRGFTEACKSFEGAFWAETFDHGFNPVLYSHAGNVSIKRNEYGDMMLDKTHAETERIDGMVGAVMSRALAYANADDKEEDWGDAEPSLI